MVLVRQAHQARYESVVPVRNNLYLTLTSSLKVSQPTTNFTTKVKMVHTTSTLTRIAMGKAARLPDGSSTLQSQTPLQLQIWMVMANAVIVVVLMLAAHYHPKVLRGVCSARKVGPIFK